MFESFTYYPIFNIPFIVYFGIVTILLFIITAMIAILKRKGKLNFSVKWHYYLAYISITSGLAHGIITLLAYI